MTEDDFETIRYVVGVDVGYESNDMVARAAASVQFPGVGFL